MLNPATISLIKELKDIVEPLLHLSDSSAPYNVSAIGKDNDIVKVIKSDDNIPVEELTADAFFSKMMKLHPWITDEERYRVYRYKDLEKFCKQNLSDLSVVKIGELLQEVHMVGKTREGDYVILSTSELHLPKHIAFDY